MNKSKYESLFDAFRDLGSVEDDEVLTPQTERLIREGKEFSLGFGNGELEDAKAELSKDEDDDEIEVIDVNANTLEHIKDKKEYVGQVIIQCNKCHANKFIDMTALVADENDPELYNVEDECPNCHAEGEGFELVGQVAKVDKPEPEAPVEPETPEATAEEPAVDGGLTPSAEENEEQPQEDQDVKNAENISVDVGFENDQTEPDTTEEDDAATIEEPKKDETEDTETYKDEESDGMETTASDDDDEELKLPELGDEFDGDEVRKDDTEDDEDEEDKKDKEDEKVKEELEPEKEMKPVRRKLRLPTRESLEAIRTARVALTEELFHKFILPESISTVVITSGNTKIYEGVIEEMPEEIADSSIEGFDVANGFLMCNVDPATDTVDTPLAKVLNCFTDNDTTKVCVWDIDTNEELFQGSKAEVLAKFGHCQLVSIDAPKTLRLNIKGEHKCECGCPDGKCVCGDHKEDVTPEDALLDKIFKANDMARYNVDNQRSEEFWVAESVFNKEDLPFVYDRYIKNMSEDLIEEFKKVTGFKDEVDEFEESHNVKMVPANESFVKSEFDEMMALAAQLGMKTVAELQEFSKEMGGAKDQDLLAALRRAVELKKEKLEQLGENVKSFKTRRALAEELAKIKGTDIQYRVRRSLKEGYRYDLVVEAVPADEPFNKEEYMKEAEAFAKEIKTFPLAKVQNLYYDDYKFDEHEPEDDAEKLISAALVARIKEITGKDPNDVAEDDYMKEAKEFAKEISNYSLIKAEELYYDEYGFDTHKPEDAAEQVVADALVARIKEISTKEPVIAGQAVKEDFVEEEVSEETLGDEDEELEEDFVEDSGEDLQDKFGFLSNDELEAIAGYEEVIKFFEKKGVAPDKIIDKLKEFQEDEEEHLEELKDMFKEITGEDLIEIEEDEEVEETSEPETEKGEPVAEPETEIEVVPVAEAKEKEVEDDDTRDKEEDKEDKEVEAIDVIKDKLDIQGDGKTIVVAEKGQLDNPEALKIEVEATKEEATAVADEFKTEEAPEVKPEEKAADVEGGILSKEFLKELEAKGEIKSPEEFKKEYEQEHKDDEPVEDDSDSAEDEIGVEKPAVEEDAELTEVLVEPKAGESEQEYVSRFMGTKLAQKEFPDEKQKLAVAYSKFRSKKEAIEEAKEEIIQIDPDGKIVKDDMNEDVSPDNPFLKSALDKFKAVPKAKGVIVSFRKPGGKEEEVGVLYYTADELKDVDKDLRKEHGSDIYVSAIHDRDMIPDYEKSINESVAVKPFFLKVEDKPEEEVEFDEKEFDENLNSYFDEAYDETVLYKTTNGSVDAHGNVVLEGLLTSEYGEKNITFTLTPETAITEELDTKALGEKVSTTSFKVKNNLSEEVFVFERLTEK